MGKECLDALDDRSKFRFGIAPLVHGGVKILDSVFQSSQIVGLQKWFDGDFNIFFECIKLRQIGFGKIDGVSENADGCLAGSG